MTPIPAQISAVEAASRHAGATELADAVATLRAVPALLETARAVLDGAGTDPCSTGPWLDVETWTQLDSALSAWPRG